MKIPFWNEQVLVEIERKTHTCNRRNTRCNAIEQCSMTVWGVYENQQSLFAHIMNSLGSTYKSYKWTVRQRKHEYT